MSDQPGTIPQQVSHRSRERVVTTISLLVILFFLLSPTSFPLGKLDSIAYAVCHRIPERSFYFDGHPLPLCARCSGTFLGVLLTLTTLTLAGRARASRLPPPRVLAVLAGFVLAWAFDGFNSYLTLYSGAPHLYEPQNWLRLTTGMMNGLALGTLIFAVFNFSLWRAPQPRPAIRGLRELAGLVALAALLIGLVLTGDDRLLYPLALVSTSGVVVMLTSVNTILVLVAARRENTVHRWRDATWPLLVALALSLAIVMGIGAARAALGGALGQPF